jgi:endonuclease YncB( thermonuclease family)
MKPRRSAAVCLALALLLLAALPEFSARVVGVSEGDTITVLHDDNPEIIRLYGIDAPENSQPFGAEADKFISALVSGKTVTVRVHGTDRYHQTIAEVLLPDGRSLAQEVVKGGFAWWDPKAAPEDKELQRLQAEAKAAKRGLWAQANPVAPWDWENPVHVRQMNISTPQTQVVSPAGATGANRPAGASAPNSRPGSPNRPALNPPASNQPAAPQNGANPRPNRRNPPANRP